jgi:hypothetical protein
MLKFVTIIRDDAKSGQRRCRMNKLIMVALAAMMLCGCFLVVRSQGTRGTTTTTVVTGPALRAQPRLVFVPEAGIYYAPDVPDDVFYYESSWYWYTNGAWYISASYGGPWRAVASVPSSFYRIPESHPKYHVVGRRERYAPGRPAWTNINSRPRLVYIPDAGIYYAPDISTDLFLYGSTWYWYADGAWYSGTSYNGPWVVVSAVPASFYRIPASHPKYRVIRDHGSPVDRLRDKSTPGATPATPAIPPRDQNESPVRKLRDRSGAVPTPATPPVPTPPAESTLPVRPTPAARPETPSGRGSTPPGRTKDEVAPKPTPAVPSAPPKEMPPTSNRDKDKEKPGATPAVPGGPGTPATPAVPPGLNRDEDKDKNKDRDKDKGKDKPGATPAAPAVHGSPASTAGSSNADKDKEEKEKKEKEEKEKKEKEERGKRNK